MPDPYVTMIHALEKRIENQHAEHQAHLKDCLEERRAAATNRHDFRAEVANTLEALSNRMEKGFAKLGESISKVHERINATDGRVHAVDKQADKRVVGWIIGGMGTAIVILTGALLKVLL
jgi:chromosome segregation ATPase